MVMTAMAKHITRKTLFPFLAFVFISAPAVQVQGTITLPDDRMVYKSVPATFGLHFDEGREYLARLQSLDDDPYLCDWDGIPENSKKIVIPTDGLPVAILAEKGQCTFEYKARLAQVLHPSIKYLIVYDDNPGKEVLIKMSTDEASGINLGLLYVTYMSGQDMLLRILSQQQNDKNDDGIRVYLDSYTPWDDISLMWIFLALACGMISILLCINTSYLVTLSDDRFRIIVVNGMHQYEELLTEEEVGNLPEVGYQDDDEDGSFFKKLMVTTAGTTNSSSSEENTVDVTNIVNKFEHYSVCSICLEEFELGEKIRLLPKCHHYFHSDCIIPWLTERHPTCPLCKTNVKEDLAEERDEIEEGEYLADEDENNERSLCTLCCRCTRRNHRHDEENVVVNFDLDDDDDDDSTQDLIIESISPSSSMNSLATPLLESQFEEAF